MTVEALSKKWKSLRDSYIRARANINKKLASGSSAEEKVQAEKLRRTHKHYDLLMFLDDSLTTRRFVTIEMDIFTISSYVKFCNKKRY